MLSRRSLLVWCVVVAVGLCCSASSRAIGRRTIVAPPQTVRLIVSPQTAGSVIENVYARLVIHGHDDLFKVDTGAAQTVITTQLAQRLHLSVAGRSARASTVGCHTSVLPVRLTNWALGAIRLPPATVLSQHDIGDGLRVDGQPVVGLLGSDLLSRFKNVTLNFAAHQMILGGPAVHGRVVPIRVNRAPAGAVTELLDVAINGRAVRLLIDTGSPLTLLDAQTSTQDHLDRGSRQLVIHGAAGCSSAQSLIVIRHWTTGRVALAPAIALTPRKPASDAASSQPIGGLIGLSVLSSFPAVTIGFASRHLALARPRTSGVPWAAIATILGAVLLLIIAGIWTTHRDRPKITTDGPTPR